MASHAQLWSQAITYVSAPSLLQDSVLPAADFSMLPPLDRPKTLVDEQGRDLPTLQQEGPEQRKPQNGCESYSVEENSAMLFLSSMEECKCLLWCMSSRC